MDVRALGAGAGAEVEQIRKATEMSVTTRLPGRASNRQFRTASAAAASSSGIDRVIVVAEMCPSASIVASSITVPDTRAARAMVGYGTRAAQRKSV